MSWVNKIILTCSIILISSLSLAEESYYLTLKNDKVNGEIINIGSGKPIKIRNLIIKICKLVGSGNPQFGKIQLRKDEIKNLYPKILKSKKILKWKPEISIENGLRKTIRYFKVNIFNEYHI